MTVRYRNVTEDLVALYQYHLKEDAPFQKRRRTWVLFPMGCFVGGLIGNWYRGFEDVTRILANLTTYGLWLLLVWNHYRRFPGKTVKRRLRDDPQQDVLCEHSAQITAEGITITTNRSTEEHPWHAFPRFGITDNHVFLYIEPMKAHILPRRDLGDEAFDLVKNLVQSQTRKPPAITQ